MDISRLSKEERQGASSKVTASQPKRHLLSTFTEQSARNLHTFGCFFYHTKEAM